MAVHNDEIIISLRALKVKYFDTERLMCTEEPVNVNRLRSTLHDINVEFNNLMCLAINIDEKETMQRFCAPEVFESCFPEKHCAEDLVMFGGRAP